MKKFVSKVLAGALGLSMLCGVAAAEGETYVSWYTFGDVYLSSVRTALDAAMEAKGLTVVDKDSNANQQTQTDDINTAWSPARTPWSSTSLSPARSAPPKP
ncbi:MAG: hypothetical protein ACLVB5_01850 [Christensenellales bacterium]